MPAVTVDDILTLPRIDATRRATGRARSPR